jgi:hypothetical protein
MLSHIATSYVIVPDVSSVEIADAVREEEQDHDPETRAAPERWSMLPDQVLMQMR